MTVVIPPQRGHCPTFPWCSGSEAAHRVHVGELHVLNTTRGAELRVSLNAEDDQPPRVHLEATFDTSGPAMDLAELDPTEAVELAGVFLRLARIAQGATNGAR